MSSFYVEKRLCSILPSFVYKLLHITVCHFFKVCAKIKSQNELKWVENRCYWLCFLFLFKYEHQKRIGELDDKRFAWTQNDLKRAIQE